MAVFLCRTAVVVNRSRQRYDGVPSLVWLLLSSLLYILPNPQLTHTGWTSSHVFPKGPQDVQAWQRHCLVAMRPILRENNLPVVRNSQEVADIVRGQCEAL